MIYLHVNQSKHALFLHAMARIKSRKSRARQYTPPPDVYTKDGKHPETPSRAGAIFAKLFAQATGQPTPKSIIRDITGISERSQTKILQSHQPCTRHNRFDSGPDPHGRKPVLLRSDTAATGSYLNDDSIPLEDHGAPWKDVAEAAGVTLPNTQKFKPLGIREISANWIGRRCRVNEDLINAVCEEEKELPRTTATTRVKAPTKPWNLMEPWHIRH